MSTASTRTDCQVAPGRSRAGRLPPNPHSVRRNSNGGRREGAKMRKAIVGAVGAIVFSIGVIAMSTGTAGAHSTCEGVGALQNHGQHIVGDYVTGIGGIAGTLAWPPRGGVVGE